MAFGASVWRAEAQTPQDPISHSIDPLPDSIDFARIRVNELETREVEVRWPGPGTVTFRVDTGGPFEVTPTRGTLEPGDSVTLRISVRAATAGAIGGFAQINFESPNAALPESRRIALKASAEATKGSDGRPPEEVPPRWNSWVQVHPDGPPVQTLSVNESYKVQFDLADVDYAKSFEGVPSSGIDIAFKRELSRIPGDSIEVLAVPVLLGRGLRFLDGEETARIYTIDLKKLRAAQDAKAEGESLPAFSERVRAMQATVGVEAEEPGCAAIALTLWNRSRNQPLDHVVRELNVGGAAACGTDASAPLKTGLLSLLALPFERPAAAALHVFETRIGSANPAAAAVFIRKDSAPVSWRPPRLISDFVGGDGAAGLRHQITLARCAHAAGEAGCSHDYSTVGSQMRDVLFKDSTAGGQKKADEALAALLDLTRTSKPDVFIRLVDSEGHNFFLPLGLLGLAQGQTLGQKATLITPLPKQTAHAEDTCVGSWRFVLPNKLQDVGDQYLTPIPSSPRAGERIAQWKDFVSYAQPTAQPTRSEGFLLLTHHTGGLITFDPTSTDSLQFTDFKREFPPGSIAVLAGCSVGQLAGANAGLPLLTTLNDQGISAAIVSPFDINGEVGARFAMHFTDVVERARRAGQRPTLRTLFETALADTRKDSLIKGFASELDELLLIGDSQISLCKEGP